MFYFSPVFQHLKPKFSIMVEQCWEMLYITTKTVQLRYILSWDWLQDHHTSLINRYQIQYFVNMDYHRSVVGVTVHAVNPTTPSCISFVYIIPTFSTTPACC